MATEVPTEPEHPLNEAWLVQWEIDIWHDDAPTPLDAALAAHRIQRDHLSISTVFTVTGPDGEYEVDVQDGTVTKKDT